MQARLNPGLVGLIGRVPVIPVLTIDDADRGLALARALVAGGLDVIEITLRTGAALDAIARIAREFPSAIVGAGTVLEPIHGEDAIRAGAKFLVSPGMTPRLIHAAQGWRVPFLPGAVTASEAMALADLGYRVLKFFPAEPSGGAAALKALAGPLPDIRFCPTGGIDAAKARSYLALPNVICVGGSWIAPADAVANGDWPTITTLAASAAALRG